MAVPKRKVSKARRDKRRSNVWKLTVPGMTACPKCGALGNWSVYHTCQGGYVWECNVCKVRGVLEESDNYSVMHTNRL